MSSNYAISVTINKHYLKYMASRLHIRGKFNHRKLVILWACFSAEGERITPSELYFVAGWGCTYGAFRASLHRLTHYEYLTNVDGKYGLRVKGKRFLYAISELHPDLWRELNTSGAVAYCEKHLRG